RTLSFVLVAVLSGATALAGSPAPPWFTWATVVNNNDKMPGAPLDRTFNSYNQPSINVRGLVVIRARSIGGGGEPATHGIYTRDMSDPASPGPIVKILDRSSVVPEPNNQASKFIETPSFPRIDMTSDTIATRGNHQPVWAPESGDEKVGTTGIYTNPFGDLITGAAKLGAVDGFDFYAVPGVQPLTMFDVFPGAPAVTDGKTTVFKGNYTVAGAGKTGVFYRELKTDNEDPHDAYGGSYPVRLIANNAKTLIPGTGKVFGSTSPPSAAGGQVVFAGFDDEKTPTLGGIYRAALPESDDPQEGPLKLTPLVSIGERVPGESVFTTFNQLGEGGAFDGRYVGFWGAWGEETRTVRLYCPTEGNKDRIAYCNQKLVCADTGETERDPNSTCDDTGCYQDMQVPVHQGIFVHDSVRGGTKTVAKTGARFDEFVFWNYSGKTPCVGSGGHGQEGAEDDGEPARWRSSAFVAVSGLSTAFKAATGGVVGIYFGQRPGQAVWTVLDTTTDGPSLDPEAPAGSTITELGLEREGLRGDWLAVS
ncbi:MAG: hypothetical protein IH608_08930, partial [Proteobacteria bacterium]|nr:hypothetical protein [Pseudomonadota bacterium]